MRGYRKRKKLEQAPEGFMLKGTVRKSHDKVMDEEQTGRKDIALALFSMELRSQVWALV